MEIRAAFICWLGNILVGLLALPVTHPSASRWLSGLALYLLGLACVMAAKAVNPFFVPALINPPYLVTTGIYRWLRHPGYIGFVLSSTGWFWACGASVWAVPFLLSYLLILWRRVRRENHLLYGA